MRPCRSLTHFPFLISTAGIICMTQSLSPFMVKNFTNLSQRLHPNWNAEMGLYRPYNEPLEERTLLIRSSRPTA
jgi:hypothetical protein